MVFGVRDGLGPDGASTRDYWITDGAAQHVLFLSAINNPICKDPCLPCLPAEHGVFRTWHQEISSLRRTVREHELSAV